MSRMTQKQENFCKAFIETGNATEAYRRAYDSKDMQPQTINRKAKELMDNGKVTARLDEMRSVLARDLNITVERITNMLLTDRELAQQKGEVNASITAANSLAKLHGLIIDKSNVNSNNRHHHATGDVSPLADWLEDSIGNRAENTSKAALPN